MKGILLSFLLLSFFMAISEVKSDKFVKVCGKELTKTIVFICGGSRWRRHLTDHEEGFLGQESHPHVSRDLSTSDSENGIHKPEARKQEFVQAKGDMWSKQQRSIQKRKEDIKQLTDDCCNSGCFESSLRSLC